jgi:hypothetical protein
MTVDKEGASIQFTCATGLVPMSIKLDKNRNFKVDGEYRRSSGAPPPNENFNRPFKAIYTGQVSGKILQLSVQVDSLQLLLYHTLELGNKTIVPLCP